MKLRLRTKMMLSYIFIVSLTLVLLSFLIESQIESHFNDFYDEISMHASRFPDMEFLMPRSQIFLGLLNNSIFLTAIGAGILAILVGLVITNYILKPIQLVTQATKAIARGKYEGRVQKFSDDELGELSESLNQMAQSLEDNRHLQQELMVNVTHELATPLTNLGGYLEALMDGVITKNTNETYKLMKEETDRLAGMVKEVRTLSLVQSPHFEIQPEELDLEQLVKKVIKHLSAQFKQKKVELSLDSKLTEKIFRLDMNRMIQVLMNLLNNALQHTPEHKAVRVLLSNGTGFLQIVVEDEGTGIPKKHLPFVFERFYRADASRSRYTGGIGVGLSIVKELVTAHGGTITVQSEPGKGSIFICSFPIGK